MIADPDNYYDEKRESDLLEAAEALVFQWTDAHSSTIPEAFSSLVEDLEDAILEYPVDPYQSK